MQADLSFLWATCQVGTFSHVATQLDTIRYNTTEVQLKKSCRVSMTSNYYDPGLNFKNNTRRMETMRFADAILFGSGNASESSGTCNYSLIILTPIILSPIHISAVTKHINIRIMQLRLTRATPQGKLQLYGN